MSRPPSFVEKKDDEFAPKPYLLKYIYKIEPTWAVGFKQVVSFEKLKRRVQFLIDRQESTDKDIKVH